MTDTRPYIDQERSVTEAWSEGRVAPARARGTEQAPAHVNALPPAAATTRRAGVVAADAPDRRIALHATMAQLFLRFDRTHELPHIVETKEGHVVARFEKDADLAWFIRRGKDERPTLPAEYVMQLAGGQ